MELAGSGFEGHQRLTAQTPASTDMQPGMRVDRTSGCWKGEADAREQAMIKAKRQYKSGDPVIYRVTKSSACPGPRAKDITPAEHGETYTYQVDKFWLIDQLLDGNRALIRTRRGKTRIVELSDVNLRPARWWELLLHRAQFPTPHGDGEVKPKNSTNSSALMAKN